VSRAPRDETPRTGRSRAPAASPIHGGGLGTFDGMIGASDPVVSAPVLEACDVDDPTWVCEQLLELTDGNEAIASIVDSAVGVAVIVAIAAVVAWIARRHLARLVARIVAPDRSVLARRLEQLGLEGPPDPAEVQREQLRRESRGRSISAVVGSTLTVTIWVITGLLVLGEIGIQVGPLIASAGIAGVALSFGAQTLVKDCIAGLFVLVEDQYGIGDVVDLDEATGVVEEITLRATVLRGLDGTVWHVPNGEVQRVGNMSQLWSVAVVDVDVAYDTDLERARTVITDAAAELCHSPEWDEHVLEEPQVLGVEILGADGITIRLTVRTTAGSQWGLQRALRERFKTALDEADIEIPFPQRTLWVRGAAGARQDGLAQ
jgi:small-conductance mechanosensitive channel